VWNMCYDPDAPAGDIGEVTSAQLWDRFERFLRELVPVAEEAGVRLAAHPDDPPMPTLRDTARLVYQPHLYERLLGGCSASFRARPMRLSSAWAASRK